MPNPDDEHDELRIPNLVKDPIVAHPDAPDPPVIGQELCSGGPRIHGKPSNRLANPALDRRRQLLELPTSSGYDLNTVPLGHFVVRRLAIEVRLDLLPRDRHGVFGICQGLKGGLEVELVLEALEEIEVQGHSGLIALRGPGSRRSI